ncbi:hypothetical protein Patl1_09279 [Pistacia atlantica]|uniref:Uncharacterized protein n=1 Tax=Pistacia atlantica TaxID=434234 RepID=A0ACC1ACU7_9ROSI|nr:hypothetical protein Patl1_09279 [Pistacia atlantica]
MGASPSTSHNVPNEQREVESLAASTGSLPVLQNAFSKLHHPQTNLLPRRTLQQCFNLNYKNPNSEAPLVVNSIWSLLDHVGVSIADLFFVPEKGGLSWVEFVKGYVKCCGRMPTSMVLNTLLRIFCAAGTKAGLNLKLEFESDDADCKVGGYLLPVDVLMIFWMSWTLLWDSRTRIVSEEKVDLWLPDVNHLVLSAVMSCAEVGSDFNVWDCSFADLEVQLPAGKFLQWAFTTVPSLTECFTKFVNARLHNCVALENALGPSTSSLGDISSTKARDNYLLSREGHSQFPLHTELSSLHGKGLNRFWSNIEGYHGPLLILVSANSGDAHGGDASDRKWIIGALTEQGFENRDVFLWKRREFVCYKSSLPCFLTFWYVEGNMWNLFFFWTDVLKSTKEKNFVYSHLHPSGKVYEPHPKPVGIAFGGTIGNERIFIDEDFAKVTVRHHAVDKTYRPGSLFPCQGFLPVEAPISEVEVWGLGGSSAKQSQNSYKKREELFTEQRRKVDMKTFASWEDSPEKMMMDMVSDPNAVRREDR